MEKIIEKPPLLKKKLVAIDPLAMILPGSVYARVAEMLNPHIPNLPRVQEVAEVLKRISPAELQEIEQRVEVILACSTVVKEAAVSVKASKVK